jgi:hypothetical protein
MTEIMRFSLNVYKVEISNNEIILTPIRSDIRNYIINEEELFQNDFTNSTINYCIIKDNHNNNVINIDINRPYISCLIDLYRIIPTSIILQNTTFNILLTEENQRGYRYYPDIRLSIQRRDTNATIKEIIKMVRINLFEIDIGIKLSIGNDIYYKNF